MDNADKIKINMDNSGGTANNVNKKPKRDSKLTKSIDCLNSLII